MSGMRVDSRISCPFSRRHDDRFTLQRLDPVIRVDLRILFDLDDVGRRSRHSDSEMGLFAEAVVRVFNFADRFRGFAESAVLSVHFFVPLKR